MRRATTNVTLPCLLLTFACSSTTVTNSSPSSSGGRSDGGSGNTESLSNRGGTSSAGGTSALGGLRADGGTVALGGSSGLGGIVGGSSPLSGGAPSNGGTQPTGGHLAAGGTQTIGGTQATGSTPPIGGANLTGGTASAGTSGLTGNGQAGIAGKQLGSGGSTRGGAAGRGGSSGAAGRGGSSGAAGRGGSGGAAGRGGSGGTAGQLGSGCNGAFELFANGLCVTKMVAVGTAGASFEIDATEVTRGQYTQWQATGPATPSSTDANCGYKSTSAGFAPDSSCIASSAAYYTGANADHHPVVCVDWCDAFYYCRAVGKRLCGRIGGGAVPFASANSATISQWYAVCTNNGQTTFPYGSTYSEQKCNGVDYTPGSGTPHTTLPVGSLGECQTLAGAAYAGVYDLSGNAAEWVNACEATAGADGLCQRHGGSFRAPSTDPTGTSGTVACTAAEGLYARSETTDGVGFRCCSLP